jgi:hypothetical protein
MAEINESNPILQRNGVKKYARTVNQQVTALT